ncbi:multidrug efflux system outer membrane protein [Oxalobacteraceae bacterium GrIS 1.11]
MKKTILTLAALALLGGCSLAPVYQRPASPVAGAWPSGPSYQAEAAGAARPAAPDIAWRDFFADARLRRVIEFALANNRDLRLSALNIDKARAEYGIERAALLPGVAATAGGTAARTPAGNGRGEATISHQYSANLAAVAYELDFFGRVRNLSDAALQQYLGTQEARDAQQISLVAEVAALYLNLAADQERLRLAQDTLKSQQLSYELSQRRFKAGATSGLDMVEAQTSVEAARVDAALYTSQVALDVNALTLVAGGALAPDWLPQGPIEAVGALTDIPAGMPSDLLGRRPDVLEAERSLRAANANIGAARAAFFPRIALTGSAGSASGDLSGLFKGGSAAWSFMPQVSLPIFDAGANRSRLEVAKVERDMAVARYEKAIQTAFREVSDELARRGTAEQRLASQEALVEAASKSYAIHHARYEKGAESYLNALISQRALYAAQQNLISVRLSKLTNLVGLYKVLGGGWQAEGADLAAGNARRAGAVE